MDISAGSMILWGAVVVGLAASAASLKSRIALSRAKHPSLAGHPRLSRRIAASIPSYSYDESTFFRSDAAPADVAEQRREGLRRLSESFRTRFAKTADATETIREGASDLRFVDRYRVPFQYGSIVRQALKAGSVLQSSAGVTVTDLDGNVFYDLSGSYGVNLLGYDAYKDCLREAGERAGNLGPVLGAYHPIVADNIAKLREISGLDEVSFHMSGTEAVMQAVRLARYHTGRRRVVRFCGAYHGWWGDVQPGIGNPVPARDTYTLADLSERTLHVLRTRRDIACVLVNPIQALHPNTGAPSDSALVDSSRRASFDRPAYSQWLRRLQEVCNARGILLILDEVFVGFRLARGGAQEYFGVKADMVTYGKTLGGGLPVGVLCGRREAMARFREDRPAEICFARGTFNAHPYVMAAMQAFLCRLDAAETWAAYGELDDVWNARAAELNRRFATEHLPLEVVNMSTIWTVCYRQPSRYNWMLQFYLRDEGVMLSWVGTGRLIFSLDHTAADFENVSERFINAARRMRKDGWWWDDPAASNVAIRRRILREVLSQRFGHLVEIPVAFAGRWRRSVKSLVAL